MPVLRSEPETATDKGGNIMQRNIEKAIEQGHELIRKRHGLDITIPEMFEIIEKSKNGSQKETVYNAIRFAYMAGLAVGYRNGGK